MPKPIPPLPAHLQEKVEKLHREAGQILDRYLSGLEIDMNRHAVKHGPMDPSRAHNDLTRILHQQHSAGDFPASMMAAVLAEAILRGIARKREGRG